MKVNSDLSLSQLRQSIIGINETFTTPFGERIQTYCDYTASGKSLGFVENYLQQLLKPYANTHTEDDFSGEQTTRMYHQAETMIKQAVNAGENGRIVLTGSGATGAINRLQEIIGVRVPPASQALQQRLMAEYHQQHAEAYEAWFKNHQPVVFVGPYEHHSNEITWREGNATVVTTQLDAQGGVDFEHLEVLLQKPEYQNRLRIGSFSAASNVTGFKSDVHRLARLLHRYDALAFFDYAASGPYVDINMNPEGQGGRQRLRCYFSLAT